MFITYWSFRCGTTEPPLGNFGSVVKVSWMKTKKCANGYLWWKIKNLGQKKRKYMFVKLEKKWWMFSYVLLCFPMCCVKYPLKNPNCMCGSSVLNWHGQMPNPMRLFFIAVCSWQLGCECTMLSLVVLLFKRQLLYYNFQVKVQVLHRSVGLRTTSSRYMILEHCTKQWACQHMWKW